MDANNGGTGVGFADTLTKVADFADRNNVETIVNGHFETTTTRADLREYIQFVRDFVRTVQEGKKAREERGRGRQGLGHAGEVRRLRAEADSRARAGECRADLQGNELKSR